MKILFLTAFPPNKKTAGQNYTRQLLNDLGNNHEVDLIYWRFPDHEVNVSDKINIIKVLEVKKFPVNLINFLSIFPLFSKRYSNKIRFYLSGIASEYDVIYFDFSQVFIYARKLNHPFKIGMSHDVIAQKYGRHKLFKHLLCWIKKSEEKCLRSLSHVFTFSKKDSDWIKKEYGIQSHPVSFYVSPEILKTNRSELPIEDYYVMYGAWNRKENQDSIRWLLKQGISKRIKILGGGMPSSLLSEISDQSNIEYCGFIDNPYPVIAKSKGLIAPLFQGAGVKVKAVESLALGTPVIGTDVTFEGIDYVPFRDCGAMMDIDSIGIQQIFAILDTLTVKEKKQIQEFFFNNYNSHKFTDYLTHIMVKKQDKNQSDS